MRNFSFFSIDGCFLALVYTDTFCPVLADFYTSLFVVCFVVVVVVIKHIDYFTRGGES